MKPSLSLAQAFGVCYGCQVRHPVRTLDAYRDFASNHQRPTCVPSLLDRDALHEVFHAPMAAHDPDKTLWVGLGLEAMVALRERDGLLEAWRDNADVKQAFGASTTFTSTFASLASSATAGREFAAIDFTSTLYPDAVLRFHCALQSGTPANDKAIYVYVAGSEDGTNFADNCTGADAAITLRSPTNLLLAGTIQTPDAGALTYKSQPLPLAICWSGILPRKVGGAVRNYTGCTFNATEGTHVKAYSGVYSTVI